MQMIVTIWVAFIWVTVIVLSAHKVFVAIKNRGRDKDEDVAIPMTKDTMTATHTNINHANHMTTIHTTHIIH